MDVGQLRTFFDMIGLPPTLIGPVCGLVIGCWLGSRHQGAVLKGQVDAANLLVATKDAQVALAQRQQDESSRKLAEVTEKIAELQNRMETTSRHNMRIEEIEETNKLLQKAAIAVQNAAEASNAVGETLAIQKYSQRHDLRPRKPTSGMIPQLRPKMPHRVVEEGVRIERPDS
jgi:hypothetical protein